MSRAGVTRSGWLGRLLGRGRAAGPASAPRREPAPEGGEPVLFVGQPRYFRSAYEDAVQAGWGRALEVRFGGEDSLGGLPARVAATGARTCVVFEPWMLAARPEVVEALVGAGVRLVAWSTEPLPRSPGADAHPDARRRFEELRRARAVPFDLWLHHDGASEALLAGEGFAPLAIRPLPVSERLFFPEEVERDVDVCFLGWASPRRATFLAPLEARFHVVHVAHGFFDEDARRLMNRSKVVVNLHAHDFENFENRCVQALFCGRPLVSEEVSGGYLTPGADYALARTPREMVACVREILEGGGAARRAPAFDRARFLVGSSRDLLVGRAPAAGAP